MKDTAMKKRFHFKNNVRDAVRCNTLIIRTTLQHTTLRVHFQLTRQKVNENAKYAVML